MGKYSLLTMKKKFRGRWSSIQIGLRFLQIMIILLISPNLIVLLIIIKKANNKYFLNN